MSERTWDAVVIGGGPAGALCATLLGRQGWSVLLLERTLHPAPKVCGEFLGPMGMDHLAGAGLADLVRGHGVPVARLALWSGESVVHGPLPQDGVGIRRELLDELLLAQAATVATVRRGVVVTGMVAAGAAGWQVLTRHDRIRTRLVIGADGRHSRVRAWSGLGVHRGATGRHALAAHARLPGRWEGGEMHLGPLGQIGLCPVAHLPGATLVNLNLLLTPAGVAHLRHGEPPRLLREALRHTPSLARRLGALPEGLQVRAAAHLRQRAHQAAAPGVALIGDAAFSCDPITGEGMSLALQDAAHLARCLAAAPTPTAALATYAQEHHRSHRRHRAELRLLPALVGRPTLGRAVVVTAACLPWAGSVLTQRHHPQGPMRT